jgi:thiol-disulfide isomerase/thioredoxin
MYKLLAICFIFLFSGCSQAQDLKNQTRAFVATKLAQSILTNVTVPDDQEKELCDGSGFIIHGDGHKTQCPGCKACKKSDEITQQPIAETQEPEYYIYHLGARWCGPCERMKDTTWKDESLKEFMDSKKVKLMIFDEEDSENKKFFSYYNIKLYPTILVVKVDELEKVLSRRTGFTDSQGIKTMIEGLNIK